MEQVQREAEEGAQTRQAAMTALAAAVGRIRAYHFLATTRERAAVESFLADSAKTGVSLAWLEAEAAVIREQCQAEHRAAEASRKAESAKRSADILSASAVAIAKALVVSQGLALAETLTADRAEWDRESAREAVEDVRLSLERNARAEWQRNDIEAAVESVLEAWD